jgi:hypothetical protein
MTAMYLIGNEGKKVPELGFSHRIFEGLVALVKVIIHAVFRREPVKAWVRFFEEAAKNMIILLKL